jgi:TRAP-type transport system periplasmic protein
MPSTSVSCPASSRPMSREQSGRNAPIGKSLSHIAEEKGVKFVAWMWLAGGVASRSTLVKVPDDIKGRKIRGGSREMDLMLTAAGGHTSTMPSNEIYLGMQTGALDAALTSSTSLISFRLEELAKSLTTARGEAIWFMCQPLLMSKAIFDSLPADQQKIVADVGQDMEAFGTVEAKKDDRGCECLRRQGRGCSRPDAIQSRQNARNRRGERLEGF